MSTRFRALAIILTASFGFAGCSRYSDQELQQGQMQLNEELPTLARIRFAMLRQEVFPSKTLAEPAPSLVYEGKSSELLLIEADKELYARRGVDNDYYSRAHLVGRTKNGRYFRVDYEMNLGALQDCKDKLAACLNEHFMPLSVTEAKQVVFYAQSYTPQTYQRIFGETPPAKTEPA